MTAPSTDLRSQARALPDHERERRRVDAETVTDHDLITTVVAVGVGGGEWRSSSDCAARAFAVDDRQFRRWLSEPNVELPAAVREKLRRLAFAFAVDFGNA